MGLEDVENIRSEEMQLIQVSLLSRVAVPSRSAAGNPIEGRQNLLQAEVYAYLCSRCYPTCGRLCAGSVVGCN